MIKDFISLSMGQWYGDLGVSKRGT